MSTKSQRGTKRTCQNAECGVRYYDLNRTPVTCPVCESVYQLAASPLAVSAATEPVEQKAPRKPAKKPAYEVAAAKPEDAPEAEGDDLVAIEGEEETAAADDDETFLEEEEEDGSDMSGIIGGPVAETDEQQ